MSWLHARKNLELMCNGHRLSLWEDEKVPAMDDGDLHNNVNVLNATELYN